MSKRIKSSTPVIQSREEFLCAVDEVATTDTFLRFHIVQRDKEIQKIQEAYQSEIEPLTEKIKHLLEGCEVYAERNREALFGEKQTAETELATYGYREHPPTLALLNRKWSWEAVVEAISERGKAFKEKFLRVKVEPNKDSLKAMLDEDQLGEIGLKLQSKETFGITPKTESETIS